VKDYDLPLPHPQHRYLSKRWFRAVLIVACIALGVATLVATRALSETMNKAGLQASNPLAAPRTCLLAAAATISSWTRP